MKWEEIVRIAKSDIGKSRDEVGCAGDYAWCAAWVSSVLNRAGVGKGVTSTSCTIMQREMSQNINWYEPIGFPEPGDEIFFDFDHKHEDLPLDHVGIVLEFDEDTLQITYANGNGSSEHYVTKQYINLEAKDSEGRLLVAYWMRYIGDLNERPAEDDDKEPEKEPETKADDEKPVEKEVVLKVRQLRKGMTGGDVKTLQRLLFADGYSVGQCGDDGEFGDDTENAVKKYQRDHDLDPDGIAGINTLTALWKCEPIARNRK